MALGADTGRVQWYRRGPPVIRPPFQYSYGRLVYALQRTACLPLFSAGKFFYFFWYFLLTLAYFTTLGAMPLVLPPPAGCRPNPRCKCLLQLDTSPTATLPPSHAPRQALRRST